MIKQRVDVSLTAQHQSRTTNALVEVQPLSQNVNAWMDSRSKASNAPSSQSTLLSTISLKHKTFLQLSEWSY
jgi:hypothetical protein